MVNLAYEDPENLSLPVGCVVMASFAVQRGETTREPVFAALRKFLADLLSRPGNKYGSESSPVDVILKFRKK